MRRVAVLLAFAALTVAAAVGQRSNSWYRPDVDSEFTSAKSKVRLSCETGKMVLRLEFREPFSGVAQVGPRRTRDCSVRGDGARTHYLLSVPPDACGSCREHDCPNGSFVNTLYIRYHRTLELEGDDIKTVICKYQAGSIRTG